MPSGDLHPKLLAFPSNVFNTAIGEATPSLLKVVGIATYFFLLTYEAYLAVSNILPPPNPITISYSSIDIFLATSTAIS